MQGFLEKLRIGQLIRYGYSGFLLFFLAACLEPAQTKQWVENLGPVSTPIVALVLGVAVYVFYKELLGEMVFYPVRHMLHTLGGRIGHRVRLKSAAAPGTVGSVPALLGSLNVPFGQRQWVYRCLRATNFVTPEQNQLLDLLHSEIHVIYISAVQLGAAGLYRACLRQPAQGWVLAALALVTVAFIVDWRADYLYAAYMRTQRGALSDALRSLGFRVPQGGV